MRMKYIAQIQSGLKKCKKINTNKATSRLLDGSYTSVFKGRSMNFDELREYVNGDDIKDVDWKASARSQKLLVKQYIAEKKHNIMVVMDTNRKMLADTMSGREKRNMAIMSSGTMAYLINKNGDYIGSIFSTKDSIKHFPFKMGLMNIENILENYNKYVTMENNSDVNKSLDYIIKNMNRKMIIVIVTDISGFDSIPESKLRRLSIMHDVLAINISDADIYGKNVFSIEGQSYMSEYFTKDKKLRRLEANKRQELYNANINKLKKLGISLVTIHNEDEIDSRISQLFKNHRIEKRLV